MSLTSLQIGGAGKRKASDGSLSSGPQGKKPKVVANSSAKRGREATIAYWPGSTDEVDLTVPKFGEWRLSDYSHARAAELDAHRSEPAKNTGNAAQQVRRCKKVLAKEHQQPAFAAPAVRKPESIDWKERLANVSGTGFSEYATSSGWPAVPKELPRYGAWVTDDLDSISSSLETLQSNYTEHSPATKAEVAKRNATLSPLLRMPAEIRLKIWEAYFKDAVRYQSIGLGKVTAYRHTHFQSYLAPAENSPWKSVVMIRRRWLRNRLDAIQFLHLSDGSLIKPVLAGWSPGVSDPYAPFLGAGIGFLKTIAGCNWQDASITQQAVDPGSWIPRSPLLSACSQTFNEAHLIAQEAPHTYSFSDPRAMEEWLRDGSFQGMKPERYRKIIRRLYVTFEVREEVADLLCGLVEVIIPKDPFWYTVKTLVTSRKTFDPFGFFDKVCSFWGKRAKIIVVAR